MSNYEIRVIPKKDADGITYWTAYFPAVDGCVGGGRTAEEAIKEAEENLEIFLEYMKSENMEIPSEYIEPQYSGKIALRVPKSIHKRLMEESEKEGVSLNMVLNNAISHYFGILEYNYKFDSKISSIQSMTSQSLSLQRENFSINQQLLWNQPINISETVFKGDGINE